MVPQATKRVWRILTFALGAACVLSGTAFAQPQEVPGEPLAEGEDPFIFFVDGFNVRLTGVDGTVSVVENPADPGSGDMVAEFPYGDYRSSRVGFGEGAVGFDMSAQQQRGDVLHLKLWSDPANADKFTEGFDYSRVQLRFMDSNDAGTDYEFRAIWPIPEEYHDGEWHELEIPLPPATFAELEAGKEDGSIEGNQALWFYEGAWVGGDIGGVGPGWPTEESDQDEPDAELNELWSEFDWDNVKGLYVSWDHNTTAEVISAGTPGPGGTIYLDDVYIAPAEAEVDLDVARGAPEPMSGVAITPGAGLNVISWTPNPDFGGYAVYASDQPITDITADNVVTVADVAYDAEDFEVVHNLPLAPHPNDNRLPMHYAVASKSFFGVTNPDVSNSTVSAVATLEPGGFILQLTDEEADTILDQLDQGLANNEGWPLDEMTPFVIDEENRSATKTRVDPDLSARVWAGYTTQNELLFYAEVTDDTLSFGGEAVAGGDTWQYDSVEIGFGAYAVESVFLGSDHPGQQRGEAPDYQFRSAARLDETGALGQSSTFAFIVNGNAGEIPGSGTQVEDLVDDAGNVIGYKMLSYLVLGELAGFGNNDAVFVPPASDEYFYIPFTFAVNDNDEPGTANRQNQWNFSTKFNVDGNWWQTPAQWPAVAIVGRDAEVVSTPNEQEELPGQYRLDQNYPNPFNPATSIRFNLADAQDVTLTVYNMLGQRVATLLDGQHLTAGSHALQFNARDLPSGVYMYRLEAGTAFREMRKMLLVK